MKGRKSVSVNAQQTRVQSTHELPARNNISLNSILHDTEKKGVGQT